MGAPESTASLESQTSNIQCAVVAGDHLCFGSFVYQSCDAPQNLRNPECHYDPRPLAAAPSVTGPATARSRKGGTFPHNQNVPQLWQSFLAAFSLIKLVQPFCEAFAPLWRRVVVAFAPLLRRFSVAMRSRFHTRSVTRSVLDLLHDPYTFRTRSVTRSVLVPLHVPWGSSKGESVFYTMF